MRIWILTAATVLLGIALAAVAPPAIGLVASALGFAGIFLLEWWLKQQKRPPFPTLNPEDVHFFSAEASLNGDHGDHAHWAVTVTVTDLWLKPGRRFDPRTLRLYTNRDYRRIPLFAITDVLGGSVEGQTVTVEHLTPERDRRSFDLGDVPHTPEFVRSLGFEPRPRFFPQSQDQDQVR